MDLYTETVAFVFQAEQAVSSVCGPGTVDDRALAVLAGQRSRGSK